MTSRKGSMKKGSGSPDLLSNLPVEIVLKILSLVPIRHAVRTSVLSRRWRYAWCSIPDLKFNDSCVDWTGNGPSFDDIFSRFVYRVLLLHQGPVHKFKLSTTCCPNFSDINQWVTFISRNGVKELSLDFGYDPIAPSSLFQCDNLTALYLAFFGSLKLPIVFQGFMRLKSLILECVSIDISSLEKLISGCPLLERLRIFDTLTEVLKIHAPRLKELTLFGKFEGFVLEKTPLLEEMLVTMTDDVTKYSCTLVQFIGQVPFLKKLVGLDYFAQYCSVGKDSTTFAVTHNHLWFIKLSIDFEDPSEVRLLTQLISSSPVLKELEIIGGRRGGGSLEGPATSCSDFQSEGGSQLLQLRKATMIASGSSKEIDFVKFLLFNSPALETMTVTPSSSKEGRTQILIGLLRCRRASTKAEVVFHDD